jgi:hypothetical protein
VSYLLAIASAAAAAVAVPLLWHHGRRRRVHRELAATRGRILVAHSAHLAARVEPAALRADFARDRIIRVEGFLAAETLAAIVAEYEAYRSRVERSFIPLHKKGGTLSYELIHRHAPTCLALYHSPELHRWLSAVVDQPLLPTADHDQSACSVLCYDQPGDHIGWHKDHNFYRGRHFTILISVRNRSAGGGLSAGQLQRKNEVGAAEVVDTSENVLVMFEGSRVLHRATAVGDGDERIVLSMTLCTDPHIGIARELARRVKDTAYYGVRALVD